MRNGLTIFQIKIWNTKTTLIIDEEMKRLGRNTNNLELDKEITTEEINVAIKQLKLKKSPGHDKILNEMIVKGKSVLSKPIKKLFNYILNSKHFPDSWRTNIIKPIFKSGDKTNPNNYRGIALSSCLSKLFSSVLNNRLHNYVEKNNIINPCQTGFRQGHRTTDNLFTLKTIIDKSINNSNSQHTTSQKRGNKVFVGFVDFRKAFDSIWRKGLYYKLLKNTIGGNFYHVIKDMYSDVNYTLKLNEGFTREFKSCKGVRQGCNLSPVLFNLFINDLPNIFNEHCKPIKLNSSSINCLLYADDLVLLSETAEGLQNCFDKLSSYCDQWNLEVNTDKTKVMIFNKRNRLLKHQYNFYFNNLDIEVVYNYKYLGVDFKPNGKFDLAKETFYKKATKTFYYIRKIITSSTNINIPSWIRIFDHIIKPVLTYGCEIWGMEKYSDRTPIEKLNIKLCKMLLQVNQSASNLAVRGELGRQPMSSFIHKMMIKYWKRVCTKKENSLVHEAVLYNIRHETAWATCIQNISGIQNLETFWNNDTTQAFSEILDRCDFEYISQWKQDIKADRPSNRGNNKLRTYCKFKTEFKIENYLQDIKNPKYRKFICKLRISDHDLMIEKGRHLKMKLEDRICKKCQMNVIEDEVHYILVCPHYQQQRSNLYKELTKIDSSFPTMDESRKFTFIMNNSAVAQQLATHYIHPPN